MLLLILSTLLATAAAQTDNTLINTTLGLVQGLAFPTHRYWGGIPYGRPPVDLFRWKPSVIVSPWAPSTFDATHDPVGCPQICVTDEPPHICPVKQSEDCLYLNVYAPLTPPTTPVPVLVFAHGGNFHDGYAGGYELAGGLLYDGREYTNTTGQIAVVINYRLGALGFLYGGGAEKFTDLEGNYGLMDQIVALEWVHANIGAWGGDPARVVLMGQSAGAMSISAHLTRPQTAGLYSAVIQHSNPFGEPYRSPPEALAAAAGFANYSGCGEDWVWRVDWAPLEACLRKLDTATILAASAAAELDLLADLDAILQVVVAWGPTVGTPYLPLRPLEAFQQGLVNDVPIAVGTTANETVIFVYEVLDFPLSQLLYEAAVAVLVTPAAVPDILRLYPIPAPAPSDFRVFASTVLTDALFLCPTRNATEAMQVAQPGRRSPTYHYQYNHLLNWGGTAWGANFTECDDEVCHGSDLPLWWLPRTSPGPGFGNYTAEEVDLAHTWQRYWANFAATGSRAGGGEVAWPAYTSANRATMEFRAKGDGGIHVINNVRDVTCEWGDFLFLLDARARVFLLALVRVFFLPSLFLFIFPFLSPFLTTH